MLILLHSTYKADNDIANLHMNEDDIDNVNPNTFRLILKHMTFVFHRLQH